MRRHINSIAKLKAYIFNIDLTKQNEVNLDYNIKGSSVTLGFYSYPYFIKCIHLKEEIGVYSFYKSSDDKNPLILFRKRNNNGLDKYINPDIILDKKIMNTENVFNDLIKVNDNKICFISTNEDHNELIIVLLSIYQTNKVAQRYYIINIYSLFNSKFYKSLRANLYNNFISLAFSFSRYKKYYTGFLIFNYPNGTDYEDNLIEKMFSKNEKIENFSINLNDHIVIDNNIFGLEYHNIVINDLINCDLLNLYSEKDNNIITKGYSLEKNEAILAQLNCLNQIIQCSINYY